MFKNQKGITLIALIVTVIILLILAAVSLNLIKGEKGILVRATTAVTNHEKGAAKEELELLLSEYTTKYFDDKYINNFDVGKLVEYIKEKENELYVNKGTVEIDVSEKTMTYIDKDGKTILAQINIPDMGNSSQGNVGGSELPGNPDDPEEPDDGTGISGSDIFKNPSSFYGKYVNYGGVENFKDVKWRIFNVEDGKIQLIADYYIKDTVMPRYASIRRGKNESAAREGIYNVSSTNSRLNLLNYMNSQKAWKDFIPENTKTKVEKVTGGPTLEQYENSYNAVNEITPGSNLYKIPYNVYTSRYFLATPDPDNENYLKCVDYNGTISGISYSYDHYTGLRPLVTLNSTAKLIDSSEIPGTYDIKNVGEPIEPDPNIVINAKDVLSDPHRYYGMYVNYGDVESYKGVKWRIFNVENEKIQLIADEYVLATELPAVNGINRGKAEHASRESDYCLNSSVDRATLLNYLSNKENFKQFIPDNQKDKVEKVLGGPTLNEFVNSFNTVYAGEKSIDISSIDNKIKLSTEEKYGTQVGFAWEFLPELYNLPWKNGCHYFYIISSAPMPEYETDNSMSDKYVYNVCYNSMLSTSTYSTDSTGVRLLVTLNKGVELQRTSNGTYNIK